MHTVAASTGALARGMPGFRTLAFATVIATYLLIVLGAFTRISGSGMGCGTDWPTCNGQLFPPLQFEPIVEWTHRFVGLIIMGLIGGTAMAATFGYRRVPLIMWPAWIAVGLVIFQALLGAITVKLDVPRPVVAAHMGIALLTLASSTVVAVTAMLFRDGAATTDQLVEQQPRGFYTLVRWSAVVAFIVLVSGALVRGTNTELACVGWPLCGQLQASVTRFQAEIHMGHRYMTAIHLLMLAATVVLAVRARPRMRKIAGHTYGVTFMIVLQILAGAVMVFTSLDPFWKGVHVALATLAWAGIVTLPLIAHLRSEKGARALLGV